MSVRFLSSSHVLLSVHFPSFTHSQDPRDAKDSNVKRSGCDRESSVPYVHLSILPTPSAEGLRREEYGEVSSERRKRRTEPDDSRRGGFYR